jgi:hypothetical protein
MTKKTKQTYVTLEGLKRCFGSLLQRSDAELQKAMDSVDQDAIFKAIDEDTIAIEWDRKSPINGAPASKVLMAQRAQLVPGGAIYLIKRKSDDRVIYFQPFMPGVVGRVAISPKDLPEVSAAHRAKVVQDNVLSAVKQAVLQALG